MRKIIPWMDDWNFINMNGNRSAVRLPHTWNNIDGQDGGNDYARGKCIYEKIFQRPNISSSERIYIRFAGVNAKATVYINDVLLGVHNNGYSTFQYELTEYLQEMNILKVEVDNSIRDDIYPQMADFTFYGGIYRDVELIITHENHFSLNYYGTDGLRIDAKPIETMGSTTNETSQNISDGVIDVTAYISIENAKVESSVRALVLDKDKNLVEEKIQSDFSKIYLQLQKNEKKEFLSNENIENDKEVHIQFKLNNVALWNGKQNPYQYTVKLQLIENNEVKDEITKKIGFRTYKFLPDQGFILNGKPYPLHGVSRHQDRKGIGNAISKNHMIEDMDLIEEVGANTIRLAHYQHDQFFYDLCDERGMIVWAEIPYISAHLRNGNDNTFFQMKELIVQNRHHASIVMWGLSNEITISHKNKKDMLNNHKELQEFVHELDPSRPTTMACFAMCSPFHPVTKISDIIAWNLYLGWYVPGLFLNDIFMDFYHKKYPNRCLGYSEYGAEGMPNLHSRKPKRGDHSEEYQAIYHEYMLKCFEKHPFLWGTYVWNMFDFAADARDQGGEPGMNHKGLITFDRACKKDAFYLYKAYWSEQSFIHISGKRYEYRSGKKTQIKVYTNHNKVACYVNDICVEEKTGNKVFVFNITMEKENKIEVRANEDTDSTIIYQVDQEKEEYKLEKKKNQSANWM